MRRPGAAWGLGAVPVVFLVAVLVTAGLRGAFGPGAAAQAGPPPEVTVGLTGCGAGWERPASGDQTLLLHNIGSAAAAARVVDLGSGAVVAEVEGLGSGAREAMRVDLPAGRYAVRCVVDGRPPVQGPEIGVAGPSGEPGGARPVTEQDMLGPLAAYQRITLTGLDRLRADTTSLRAAVRGGDRAAARSAWLPAYLDYRRLGAAYGAFGDSDDAIDGLPDGLPGGVADPDLTGFHRLEYGLWHNRPMPALDAVADRLAEDVAQLRQQGPALRLEARDLALRAHEIVEDAERFDLTGRSDLGSGSVPAAVGADVEATRDALTVLRPLLATRYPGLPAADAALARLADRAAAVRSTDGAGTDMARVPHEQRQQLDAAAGQAAELLAPVAAICTPRRI